MHEALALSRISTNVICGGGTGSVWFGLVDACGVQISGGVVARHDDGVDDIAVFIAVMSSISHSFIVVSRIHA